MSRQLTFALEVKSSLVGTVENSLYFFDCFRIFVWNYKNYPFQHIFWALFLFDLCNLFL